MEVYNENKNNQFAPFPIPYINVCLGIKKSHPHPIFMSFQCFVCDKSFSRAQHRSSHIRLKKDNAHQQYILGQQENLMRQFTATVDAITHAAAHVSPAGSPPTFTQENDVDQDDLPTSFDMLVDSSSESDGEQSIISGPEEPIEEDHDSDEPQLLAPTIDASDFLMALDLPQLPEILESFDFLPDPDLDTRERESSLEPCSASDRRTLLDIEAETSTYRWHKTAGRVYGQEPMIHARWQTLFDAGPDRQAYKPFNSRLDWEMAQWAIKEKIPQKSFNRLLSVPQVLGVCV